MEVNDAFNNFKFDFNNIGLLVIVLIRIER